MEAKIMPFGPGRGGEASDHRLRVKCALYAEYS